MKTLAACILLLLLMFCAATWAAYTIHFDKTAQAETREKK